MTRDKKSVRLQPFSGTLFINTQIMSEPLSPRRRSILPLAADTWETIAAREFPERDVEESAAQLQSWNLHVFMRPAAPKDSPRAGNPILPSDVIFVEPPRGKQPGIYSAGDD